ncbi:MAG TPA: AAA family ATPase [Xanthobacteraceae bacterium]|jgi:AAA domain, putative AbiEii toxin, Type IV TA system/AAA ATPase domain
MQEIHHLNSLAIDNFRAFRSLRIEGLANVNLIVGSNNLGKTSLLEALNLYCSRGNRYAITDLLMGREEYSFKRMRARPGRSLRDVRLAYESLFYGRRPLEDYPRLQIGPLGGDLPALSVAFTWLQQISEEANDGVRLRIVKASPDEGVLDIVPGLEISFGDDQLLLPLDRLDSDASLRSRFAREPDVPVVYLSSEGLGREEIGRLWDTIALTEDEGLVTNALKAISPSIEKIVLVQNPAARGTRTLMAKLEQFNEPVPFKSLGAGIEHLLAVSLTLLRARGGVLLIDEVENGIHYSVQPSLWNMIFKQAATWDIQVYATTHSWDCVEGFQIAASSQAEAQGSLFRLERFGADIRAIRFVPREIEVARRESIEVR